MSPTSPVTPLPCHPPPLSPTSLVTHLPWAAVVSRSALWGCVHWGRRCSTSSPGWGRSWRFCCHWMCSGRRHSAWGRCPPSRCAAPSGWTPRLSESTLSGGDVLSSGCVLSSQLASLPPCLTSSQTHSSTLIVKSWLIHIYTLVASTVLWMVFPVQGTLSIRSLLSTASTSVCAWEWK